MSDGTPGLEYLLLFGLPENKTEVLDGRMRTVWPFQNLREAERAFDSWCAQIERWRGTRRVSASDTPARADIGGVSLERRCRVIEMEIPISVDVLRALHAAFWRRELWDLPPEPNLPGHDSPITTGRVSMNLWKAFNSRDRRPDWRESCWGDVMLTDDTSLFLDLYHFGAEAPMELIGGDYAAGVPVAVAQILAPFSGEADRGPRLALLHRAGVRCVWLLDPALQTVDTFAWQPSGYAPDGSYASGQTIRPPFRPDVTISVTELFTDPFGDRPAPKPDPPTDNPRGEPQRLLAGQPLGLEHLLLLGHPGRRHEIWCDHSPCVLGFGSPEEARERFREFLLDAARWTDTDPPSVLQLSGDVETARARPFQLTRRRNRVYLDVEVDPHIYQTMLEALGDREVWEERNRCD